jgi:signal transduction histidine kinase
LKYILRIWTEISNIGIDSQITNIEQKKVKVLNQGIGIGLFFQSFVCLTYLVHFEIIILFLGSIILGMLLFLWYLNFRKQFGTAQFIVNAFLPLLMVLIGFLYGEKTGIQHNLIIFITTAVFFNKKAILKILFVSYNVLLSLFLKYYWGSYESVFADHVTTPTEIVSFITAITVTITLIITFLKENESYDKKNQALLKSLEQNNEELKRANEALERFAYIASHDLKTPLRTILGYTELLERDFNRGKTDSFSNYFGQIKQGTLQMNDLIKSTLEYSRVSNLETEKIWIDLNQLIKSVENAYTNDKKVSFIIKDLPTIYAEENQILSLFQNLIENGLKYNNEDFKIIEISCKTTDNSYLFTVSDNGIGIPEEFHNQIFTMFKRLHTNQQYEGTGLGLAICEKVVAKLNGKLSLVSKINEGTTFYIELPKDELSNIDGVN